MMKSSQVKNRNSRTNYK